MNWLGLDVGGANVKVADGDGWAVSRPFHVWREPSRLRAVLAELIATADRADAIALSMTGELADCFATKADGVRAIIDATLAAASGRRLRVYTVDGSFVSAAEASQRPLMAAAANWHALARLAARYITERIGLLVDIGSTTSDLIPIVDHAPAPVGRNDSQRLVAGELVYTGVRRTPVCNLVGALPWRGSQAPVAAELFATTWDAYLVLGDLSDAPDRTDTADGRPATKAAARDRLARMICADRDMFDETDAFAAATAVARAQQAKLAVALAQVTRRLPSPSRQVITSGEGEFLARRVLERIRWPAELISLGERLGEAVSHCATAHALAVLAREGETP